MNWPCDPICRFQYWKCITKLPILDYFTSKISFKFSQFKNFLVLKSSFYRRIRCFIYSSKMFWRTILRSFFSGYWDPKSNWWQRTLHQGLGVRWVHLLEKLVPSKCMPKTFFFFFSGFISDKFYYIAKLWLSKI